MLFEQERSLLRRELDEWLTGSIEHVGSTAIPGLAAKPVIDIMAGVESLAASGGAIAAASRIGYVHFPYRPDVMHWFCKPSPAFRTHHLHLVPFNSREWIERLAFRDYLRRDSTAAAEYAALKHKLAIAFEFDRESYTDAKGPFIRRVIELALPARRIADADP
jgi:GrpB-like predicted nucleotidyltransferase (UPF0157 family)